MQESLYHIDINADLGEGMPYDADLMPYISSCSIACGGHFGNETTILKTIRLANRHQVKVGAHPSFPDKDNFGRKILTMTKAALTETIYEQLTRFVDLCNAEETEINHIKLHGALYNYAAKDAPTADAVIAAIEATKMRTKLYVPPNSILSEKAKNLFPLLFEAFIDRRYETDLSLVSRDTENAVIVDPENAWLQLKNFIIEQSVNTIHGERKPIKASTFCVHGDNPEALLMLEYIHQQLALHKIKVG